jgi:hypothetical protein
MLGCYTSIDLNAGKTGRDCKQHRFCSAMAAVLQLQARRVDDDDDDSPFRFQSKTS